MAVRAGDRETLLETADLVLVARAGHRLLQFIVDFVNYFSKNGYLEGCQIQVTWKGQVED